MAGGCPSDHHFDHLIVDDIFPTSVDDLFSMIFSDSKFYRKFAAKRKTTDVKLGEWKKTDGDEGRKVRNLQYTLSINYSIGPKTSTTKEVQTMRVESAPGQRYVVDADCYNGGIPYADNFHTTVRYCLRSSSGNRTRLVVSCRVNFSKSVSSFIKIFIEKTAVSGARNSFSDFVQILRLETNQPPSGNTKDITTAPKGSSRHRAKDKPSAPLSNSYEVCRSPSFLRPECTDGQFDCAGYFLTILITALLVISLMNVFMYMQLVAMENSLKRVMSSKMR